MARTETSTSTDVFDIPAIWRAEAATALGLLGDDLAAAMSPGPAYPAVLRSIGRALPAGAGGLVVDLGAGLGGAAAWIARRTDLHVVAVEPATGSRRSAREIFPSLDVVDGDIGDVPLPDGCADAVLALNVSSLLPDLVPLMDDANRLLRSEGILAIADLMVPSGPDVSEPPNVFRSIDSISSTLLDHGFEIVEIGCGPDGPTPAWAELAARVDEHVRQEHGTDDEYVDWELDHEHLERMVLRHGLYGGVVIGRRAVTPHGAD